MESRRIATVSTSPRTAVVGAIPEELAPLVGRLTNRTEAPLTLAEASGGWLGLTLGLLGHEPLAVLVTGDGAERALNGVRALLGAVPVNRVLAVGSAGGLSPDLRPADLIMARRVISTDGSRREAPVVSVSAARAAGARLGTVVTVDDLVLTADEKHRVRRDLVPGGEAAVLDLESAHFVAAAEEAGVSWIVIRAVLDTVSESLPDFLHDCSGPGGEIQRPAVLRHAARHPRVIPDLLRMRSRIDACGRALAEAVAGYLAVSGGVTRTKVAS
jgi:nucleoside phosphorylase